MKKLSIVSTLFYSENYIKEFYSRATIVAQNNFGSEYEIIFVNDGSPDKSLSLAINLSNSDPRVVVIDLSKNFGHHKAMMAGLSFSRGHYIFLIDSDLEEMPEWLIEFDNVMKKNVCDVVYGIQRKRKGGFFERISGAIFYRLFRILTNLNQENNITTARLMTRRYVDALLLHKESEINIGGLWILTGFQQEAVEIRKISNSPTTYSLIRKLDTFINAVTSFSALPLVFIFYSGLTIFLTSLVYVMWLIFQYVFVITPPSGYVSVIASIWFFSGLIILYMGIQGIYISKIFMEVKNRPNAIIRAIYQSKEKYSDNG
jgi:putative glycosyltransferase